MTVLFVIPFYTIYVIYNVGVGYATDKKTVG